MDKRDELILKFGEIVFDYLNNFEVFEAEHVFSEEDYHIWEKEAIRVMGKLMEKYEDIYADIIDLHIQ